MNTKRIWLAFEAVIIGSWAVLGHYGLVIHRQAPPFFERVVPSAGYVVFTGRGTCDGQSVGQSMGGQEVGDVWGHGAQVASHRSASGLHHEAIWRMDDGANLECGSSFAEVPAGDGHRLHEQRARRDDVLTNCLT